MLFTTLLSLSLAVLATAMPPMPPRYGGKGKQCPPVQGSSTINEDNFYLEAAAWDPVLQTLHQVRFQQITCE